MLLAGGAKRARGCIAASSSLLIGRDDSELESAAVANEEDAAAHTRARRRRDGAPALRMCALARVSTVMTHAPE